MKQGHDKGSAFAICTATFQKGGKPIFVGESEKQKLHLFSESIRIKGNRVSGVAIHPKRIFHPEEGLTHVYLREELEKAAPTLVGKPFGIDHLNVLPPPNVITNAWYDPGEGGVAFEGTVDDQIAEQIRNRVFKGLSIELNWLKPGGKVEYVNGVAARNFDLTSVHFLKRFPPGDREAYVKLWEQLVVGPPLPLDQRIESLEKRIQEILNQINVINGKLEILAGSPQKPQPQHSPSATVAEPTQPEPSKMNGVESLSPNKPQEALIKPEAFQEAEWATEYINDLPDSAFAVISLGGQKDEHGKTVPRMLRHLPHHNAEGNLDLDHLRNALTRLHQTDLSPEDRTEAKRHLCTHAKESQIISEVCGEGQPKVSESEDAVTLRKKIVEFEAKLAESEKSKVQQSESLKRKYMDFRKMVESAIPPPHVWKAWRPGSQMMIQQLLKVLRESSES